MDPTEARARDDLSLISIKDRGGLTSPSEAVTRLCMITEKSFRILAANELPKKIYRLTIAQAMAVVMETNIHFNFPICHSTALIKTVISRYCLIRLRYETKKRCENQDNLRSKLHRLVLFNHI